MVQKFKAFWSLSRYKRLVLIEAFIMMGIARFLILFVPFRHVAGWLGQVKQETPHTPLPAHENQIAHIGWSVRKMHRYTPWQSLCLVQALAGTMMLKRRGIASTLYLGVKMKDGGLDAHAWLRSGQYYLTGFENMREYRVISTFASMPKPRRQIQDPA